MPTKIEKDCRHRPRDHRPRVGRHQGAEHAAAELVALDLLRHHRLRGRLSVLYPSWPWLSGYTRGLLGCSTAREPRPRSSTPRAGARADVRRPHAVRRRSAEIAPDPELLRLSRWPAAASAFADNCAQLPRRGRRRARRAASRAWSTTTGCGAAASTRSTHHRSIGVRNGDRRRRARHRDAALPAPTGC